MLGAYGALAVESHHMVSYDVLAYDTQGTANSAALLWLCSRERQATSLCAFQAAGLVCMLLLVS
jgi:hypothetical protein